MGTGFGRVQSKSDDEDKDQPLVYPLGFLPSGLGPDIQVKGDDDYKGTWYRRGDRTLREGLAPSLALPIYTTWSVHRLVRNHKSDMSL